MIETKSSINTLLKQHEPWTVLRIGMQHAPIDFNGPGVVIIAEERSEAPFRPLEVLVAENDAVGEATHALQQHAQRGKDILALLKVMPSKLERDQLLAELVKHVMASRADESGS
jgi:hypothetical protein